MNLYRQYKKLFICSLVVLLTTFMLHLISTYSTYSKISYGDPSTEAYDALTNMYKPFYYLNYYSSTAVLPEEETITVNFLKTATRYLQYPQRFLNNNLYSAALLFFNTKLSSYIFMSLFKKKNKNTPNMAAHLGGHAPPAFFYC